MIFSISSVTKSTNKDEQKNVNSKESIHKFIWFTKLTMCELQPRGRWRIILLERIFKNRGGTGLENLCSTLL